MCNGLVVTCTETYNLPGLVDGTHDHIVGALSQAVGLCHHVPCQTTLTTLRAILQLDITSLRSNN